MTLWADIKSEIELRMLKEYRNFIGYAGTLSAGKLRLRRVTEVAEGEEYYAMLAGFEPQGGAESVWITVAGKPLCIGVKRPSGTATHYIKGGPLVVEVDNALANAVIVRDQTARKTFWVSTGYHEAGVPSGGKLNGWSDDLVTKKWILDAATGAATFVTVNTPFFRSSNADPSSQFFNSSTSTIVTAHTFSFNLPTGTWTMRVKGAANFLANAVTAEIMVYVNGTYDTGEITRSLLSGQYQRYETTIIRTGVTGGGSIECRVGFRSPSGVQVTAVDAALTVWAERTA